MILERIAQRSLPRNRRCEQPVPCHANSYYQESVPHRELIVKSTNPQGAEQFLVRGAGASQRIAGQAIVQGFANVMLAAAILCGLALVAVCCMRTSADKDAALQHDTVDQQRAFSARID